MKRLLAIFLIFLTASPAFGTTYYISFSAGNNSNNGTSESTPWKTHPYMQAASGCTSSGSAPSYSHSAGDTFTFKQGDSWPNACFDMIIQAGGTLVGSNCTVTDTYTFDPTWGTAGGTTSPLTGDAIGVYKFTAGNTIINGGDGHNWFVDQNSVNCINWSGMEMTGMVWTGANSDIEGMDFQTSENVVLSKIWAHGWTHSGATTDDLVWFVGHDGAPYNLGLRLTDSLVDGANSGGAGVANSGAATFKIPLIDFTVMRNATNGALLNNNAVVHDNQIYNINASFDASVHENCIEPIGTIGTGLVATNYIYNNLTHDCDAVNILTQGNVGAGSEVDYLWNNVSYVGTTGTLPIPFQFDSEFTNQASSAVHAWNNTIYGGSGDVCIRTIDRGHGNFGILDLQNNHCISDSGFDTIGLGGNTQTINNNPTQGVAAAAAQGYTAAEMYAYSPTAAGNATVGAGANLTSLAMGSTSTLANDTTYGGVRATNPRPSPSAAWDAGAYEFAGSAGPGGTIFSPGVIFTSGTKIQ